MNVSDYIIEYLINLGVTDVFGIPGGVVLDFLYAVEKRKPQINAHLSFHEQSAAFSASGFAQVSNALGVVYATRGPGITNLLTAIADAYYDSIPILVITAHTFCGNSTKRRIEVDQELNSGIIYSQITKYYARIERSTDVESELSMACSIALSGRKGPVVLDFNKSVFSSEINLKNGKDIPLWKENPFNNFDLNSSDEVFDLLAKSKRPIFLIGDGVHQSNTEEEILELASNNRIPVLSSRFSQDVMPLSEFYFGYIGSHGLRYSNFILNKADLIIVFGNRLSFPLTSKSFKKILESKKIIRFEVDNSEISRNIPGVDDYNNNIMEVFSTLLKKKARYLNSSSWVNVCEKLKHNLNKYDLGDPILKISEVLRAIPNSLTLVCDVGNNEFWLSRAYAYSKISHRMLFSKSFGAMGSSLPKAIGVYYKERKPVICFTGDQGFQMNIQEIQFLARDKLPIIIVVLNNSSSGMIKSRQKKLYNSYYIHTTKKTGYSVPDIKSIAFGFGISYRNIGEHFNDIKKMFLDVTEPCILELSISEDFDLSPELPLGETCQNMYPYLESELYQELNDL